MVQKHILHVRLYIDTIFNLDTEKLFVYLFVCLFCFCFFFLFFFVVFLFLLTVKTKGRDYIIFY